MENGLPSPVTKHIVFFYMTFVVLRSTVSHCWHLCLSYSIYLSFWFKWLFHYLVFQIKFRSLVFEKLDKTFVLNVNRLLWFQC